MVRGVFVLLLLAAAGVVGALEPAAEWPQWGGPGRDFRVPAAPLATTWPGGGPARVWSRPLGEGYSALVTDGATLYTLYREGDDEVVVALELGR